MKYLILIAGMAAVTTAAAPRPPQAPEPPDPFASLPAVPTKKARPACACKAGDCHCCKACSCGGHKIKGKKRTAPKKAMKKKVNDRPVRYYHQPFRASRSC